MRSLPGRRRWYRLDGEFLGSAPPPREVYEGKHRLQVVDRETHQVLTTVDCFADPENHRPCKYIVHD